MLGATGRDDDRILRCVFKFDFVHPAPAVAAQPFERPEPGFVGHAFTRGAAYASFAEQKIGALEPGKWADFILIDRDPTKVDAQSLARTQVLETWVAGKKVWSSASAPQPAK